MLTQSQITEVINRVISILEKYDIPYKTLDNMDGSRHAIRFSNVYYLRVVDEDERETWTNPVKFMFYTPDVMVDYSYDEMNLFYDDLEQAFKEDKYEK